MASNTSILHIDSRSRFSGSSNNFTIVLKQAVDNIRKVKLLGLQLPLTSYNINYTNNKIYISDGSNSYIANVEPGVYNRTNILNAIKTAIESVFSAVITVSYDEIKLKYIISSTVPFRLDFSNTSNSISKLLGFNDVNTTLSSSHTSDNVANLSIPSAIYIRISELGYPILSSSGHLGTFLIYPLFNSGSINYHFVNSQYKLSSKGNIGNLSRMNIEIVDAYTGQLIDLNNSDFSFTIKLKY